MLFVFRVFCDAAMFDANMMQWRNVVYTAFQRCAHTATMIARRYDQSKNSILVVLIVVKKV